MPDGIGRLTLEAAELLVQISSHYPGVAFLLKLISVVIGSVFLGYGIWLILQIELFQTNQNPQFGYIHVTLLFIFSGLFISLGWSLNLIGNSLFDYGGYVLQSFEGTEDWKVQKGLTTQKAMQDFAIVTSKLLGLIFGFWGGLSLILSTLPNSQSKQWPAWVRVAVGAAFFNPIAVLDWFGGWGTKFLT